MGVTFLFSVAIVMTLCIYLWWRREKHKELLEIEYMSKMNEEKTLAEWCQMSYNQIISFLNYSISSNKETQNFISIKAFKHAILIITEILPPDLAERIYFSGNDFKEALLNERVFDVGNTLKWVLKLCNKSLKFNRKQKFKYCIGGEMYPYEKNSLDTK